MDKSTHQIRCEHWARIINECLASGIRKKDWCKANGIPETSFYYWQRLLRNEAYLEQKQFPAVSESRPEPPVAFVELKPATSSYRKTDSVSFRPDVIIRNNGIILELSNTVSPELLKQLGGLFHAE